MPVPAGYPDEGVCVGSEPVGKLLCDLIRRLLQEDDLDSESQYYDDENAKQDIKPEK